MLKTKLMRVLWNEHQKCQERSHRDDRGRVLMLRGIARCVEENAVERLQAAYVREMFAGTFPRVTSVLGEYLISINAFTSEKVYHIAGARDFTKRSKKQLPGVEEKRAELCQERRALIAQYCKYTSRPYWSGYINPKSWGNMTFKSFVERAARRLQNRARA